MRAGERLAWALFVAGLVALPTLATIAVFSGDVRYWLALIPGAFVTVVAGLAGAIYAGQRSVADKRDKFAPYPPR